MSNYVNRAILISVLWCAAMTLWYWGVPKPDLAAVWFAGDFLADGRPDMVYAVGSERLFTLAVAEGWYQAALANGYEATDYPLYPYIYPPLWAGLMAPVTRIMDWQLLFNIFAVIYPPLIVALALAVWQFLRHPMRVDRWLLACLCLASVTSPSLDALYNGQPQILVALLIIGAITIVGRHPRAAGTAMALAASIKLYPAFLAVLWIVPEHRRALIAFLVSGTVLAALSVAVTGWPLHELFLARLESVSNTMVVTFKNFNLESAIHQLAYFHRLVASDPEAGDPEFSYILSYVALKPYWMTTLSRAILVCGLAFIWLRRSPLRTHAMPALLILVALTSPLAWAHHFLTILFFLPILPSLWGNRIGFVLLGMIGIPLILPLHSWISTLPSPLMTGQLLGTASMSVCFFAFALAPMRAPAWSEDGNGLSAPTTLAKGLGVLRKNGTTEPAE